MRNPNVRVFAASRDIDLTRRREAAKKKNRAGRRVPFLCMKRLILLLLPLLTACGYALVGSANNLLAPTVHTIEVPAFVNHTTRVELEQRVTQSVAAEFVSRGRLKLVNSPAAADVILRGSIDS